MIHDGLALTIGYLITEAEAVWLHLGDGRVVEGHALGFDFVTGFGLVHALGRIDPLPFGSSAAANIVGVVVGGAGEDARAPWQARSPPGRSSPVLGISAR